MSCTLSSYYSNYPHVSRHLFSVLRGSMSLSALRQPTFTLPAFQEVHQYGREETDERVKEGKRETPIEKEKTWTHKAKIHEKNLYMLMISSAF